MRLPSPLLKARLTRRYKRFLADAVLLEGPDSGAEITAHVANPGAMLGLNAPGSMIYLSHHDNSKRKLRYSWELSELEDGHWAGVSTQHPNRIVEEALRATAIPELAVYTEIRREVKYGENSRIDFLLTESQRPDLYLEVKNVHLRRAGDWAEFPDAVTARGAKHLRELERVAAQGARAVMLYLIQRSDCARFALADDIDPSYFEAYTHARNNGVETLAYGCRFEPPTNGIASITLRNRLPVDPRAGAERPRDANEKI